MKEPVTRIMVVALNGRSIEPSWDTGEDVPGHYVDGVVNREGDGQSSLYCATIEGV